VAAGLVAAGGRLRERELARFVEQLTPALRQAAAITRALEGRVQNQPKQGESTAAKRALTVADTAAQEALLVPLLEHFPWVRVEAEEDTPSVARFPRAGEAVVVIDPVDGTLYSYLRKEGPYAVMMGLVVRGEYEAALVALPREGLFFEATRGRGARTARAGGEPRPARPAAEGERILVSHGTPPAVAERLRGRGLEVIPACGGAVAVAPLIPGVRAGVRVTGAERGLSPRGRIGALISREAGAIVRGAGGAAFPTDVDTDAPVLLVAACDEDLEVLVSATHMLV
jgi:fructose-1,6-bisphosphatase/inositol monophosphatase family enzyme